MIFTDSPLDDTRDKCYYKLAFCPERFDKLSLREKKRLILFVIALICPGILPIFADLGNDDEPGGEDENGRLYINEGFLNQIGTDSVKLYVLLLTHLCGRYIRRTNIHSEKRVVDELTPVWKKKVRRCQSQEDRRKNLMLMILREELQSWADFLTARGMEGVELNCMCSEIYVQMQMHNSYPLREEKEENVQGIQRGR